MEGIICPRGELSFPPSLVQYRQSKADSQEYRLLGMCRFISIFDEVELEVDCADFQWIVWLMCTRTAKLLPHLWYHPKHIIYVPAWILFGYYL